MENLVAPEGPYQHTDDAFQAVLNDLCQVLSSLKQRCLAAERLAKKRGKIIAEREATLRTRGQGHAKLRASTISREKHQEALREVVAERDAIKATLFVVRYVVCSPNLPLLVLTFLFGLFSQFPSRI